MKGRIAQIVDSAGSIPREIQEKYHIREVPFHINFDGQEQYRENIDISSQEFYERMKHRPDQVPKTGTAGITEWLEAFEEKYREGYRELLVTTIGRKLSANYQAATIARNVFLKNHRDMNLEVLESNTCGGGQAALEIWIAQMIAQKNTGLTELVNQIKGMLPSVVSLFSVDELTYMRAGGRIGGAAVLLGKLINIKPVCEFADGVVHPLKAVRSRKKALLALVDEAAKRIKNAENAVICVQHALCEEDADFLMAELRDRLNFNGLIYQGPVGATVGAHSGPGAIGIGIIEG